MSDCESTSDHDYPQQYCSTSGYQGRKVNEFTKRLSELLKPHGAYADLEPEKVQSHNFVLYAS